MHPFEPVFVAAAAKFMGGILEFGGFGFHAMAFGAGSGGDTFVMAYFAVFEQFLMHGMGKMDIPHHFGRQGNVRGANGHGGGAEAEKGKGAQDSNKTFHLILLERVNWGGSIRRNSSVNHNRRKALLHQTSAPL